ncbi:hypothetical protein P5637_23135 [Bacillus paralicheniformis]|uniref:Phage protein n=1 Tax=Bacillus paralicheniformis TaxID=1648923 RepID=A0ABY3FY28_9BACI|nr:hypothetical protein [Bacillus paralicheniformis]TWJ39204.1 hypothetical protein CHCC5027_2683 [Bacillus paralicheniformis]TWL40908.1 hypothetical protein CHCC15381_0449 [Bacillus paralicheniformis]WEZ24172.1 hypothetical protein P5637_23135 [Bacillus paralicheniformis]
MSEVKKPVITKEQAEALDLMRKANYDEYILMAACDGILGGELEDLDIMTLAAALINGYEVDKTPEEKVRGYFGEAQRRRRERRDAGDIESMRYNSGKMDGVRTALDILGIKIEGVNA